MVAPLWIGGISRAVCAYSCVTSKRIAFRVIRRKTIRALVGQGYKQVTATISKTQPLSVTAAFKAWIVNSGEVTPCPDSEHWSFVWEPLGGNLPADARPYLHLVDQIQFYDRSGRKTLLPHAITHHGFSGNAHPHLLYAGGVWREVIHGRCEYRDGQWWMKWTTATNSRLAEILNEGYRNDA